MVRHEANAAKYRLGIPLSEFTEELIPVLQGELKNTTNIPVQIKEISTFNYKDSRLVSDMKKLGLCFYLANREVCSFLRNNPSQTNYVLLGEQQSLIIESTKLAAEIRSTSLKKTQKGSLRKSAEEIENRYATELRYTFFRDLPFIMDDNFQTIADIFAMIASNSASERQALRAIETIIYDTCPDTNMTYMEVFSDMPMGFWAVISRHVFIPTVLIPYTSRVDPKFISTLIQIKKDAVANSDDYHGGCPARFTTYFDKNGVPYPFEKSAITQLSSFFLESLKNRLQK